MKQDRKSLLFTQISAPGIAAASPDALVGDTAESPTLTNHEGRNDFVWVAPSYLLLKGQHRFKRMDYVYDLISGNVHRVDYETGKADQWHHAYSYDADNRITDVYTSTETPLTTTASSMASLENEAVINPLWDKEADYSYYAHGPLARTVLGDEEVQGLDYVYTLQGWIKSVNSNTLDPNRDPGEDGKGLAANRNVARDVYGYSLHYFDGDYAGAIGGNNSFIAAQPMNSGVKQNSFDLYNGNIATMVTTITNPNTRVVLPLGNAYKYDQLNRLKEARSYNNIDLAGNTWNTGGTQMYYNALDYDANGNIIHQVRHDDANQPIDDMSYYYEDLNGGIDSKYVTPSMKVKRNRLHYVRDGFDYDLTDIDPGMANNNYQYDAEGRLTKDLQERIDRITWRVDGKVRKIERTPGGPQKNLIFDYDAMGHRIAKHVYTSNNIWENSTYYILDAQGNTMSVYKHANDDVNHVITFAQTEKHIYGSSRLGTHNEAVPMFGSQNATYSIRNIAHHTGKRVYELSNHLGNVLSVISDKVIPHNSGGTVDYWLADIRQATDYSPFGVTLKGRDLPLTSGTGSVPYRYGYQGSEMDNEVKGDGNSYTTEFRLLDPRLGRWLSLDPMMAKLPWQSPYCSMDNNPIWFNDQLGDVASGKEGDWQKGEKGSRKKDNANGSSTYDAPVGTVILPKRAKILGTLQDGNGNGKVDYKGKTLEGKFGDLNKFELDGVVYTSKYSNGKFMGYFDTNGKKYDASKLKDVIMPTISPAIPPKPVNSPFELYVEANAEKNSGNGLGANLMGIKGIVYFGQQTEDGINYNTEEGVNRTGVKGTKDMGTRYGIGYGQFVPYIGELGGELQYVTYKNGKNSLTLSVNVAFVGRVEFDFLQGELFYGLQGSASMLTPWVGYDASVKIGNKVKCY